MVNYDALGRCCRGVSAEALGGARRESRGGSGGPRRMKKGVAEGGALEKRLQKQRQRAPFSSQPVRGSLAPLGREIPP